MNATDSALTTETSELEQKKRFAIELLRNPSEEFKAALAVFPDDTGKALLVSNRWPSDPEVIALKEMAIDELGDMHFLPTKADLAREAWNIAVAPTVPVDDRLKAMRLYGDIRGYIEKQGTVVNNNVLTNNKVMVVKSHASPEEWEQRLVEQQKQLIHDADTPTTVN